MNRIVSYLVVCLAFSALSSFAAAFAADRHIAFERNNAVYVANLDGTNEKRIADGSLPAISPDGTRIAFNILETGSETTFVSHIAVTDIAIGKTTVFKSVPSDRSYHAAWSPDGTRILFTLRRNELWDLGLGLISVDGTGFRFLKKDGLSEVTCYSSVWARDGQSVFYQDMRSIYRLGFDGAVLAQWEIEKTIPNGEMSGDSRIDVSPDGKRLLLSIDMSTEGPTGSVVWVGTWGALWSFDLESQHAVRLTPTKLSGRNGVWLDNDNILFVTQATEENEVSIYRMSINGKNLKRLIKNAQFPSVSGP